LRYLKNYPQLVFAGPICSDQEIQKIHSDKVASLGVVQDVRDFYMEIDVALSPIRFGGGLKIKVFEALANGKSVIATQHSAEGFPSGIKEIINIEDDFSKWDMSLLEKTYKIKTSDIEEYYQANFSYEKCEHILRSMI
jgi:glycosyltransferase involved in cell wall biosynthesis